MQSNAPHNQERMLLTPAAAAHLLSVGRTTLYELLGQGELQFIKIGRLCRIPRDELDAFIARKQRGVQTNHGTHEEGEVKR